MDTASPRPVPVRAQRLRFDIIVFLLAARQAALCVWSHIKSVNANILGEIGKLVGEDIHSADHILVSGFNWCPPLAMIEALFGVDNVKKLIMERINKEDYSEIDINELFNDVENSKYDFRKYIRAKY